MKQRILRPLLLLSILTRASFCVCSSEPAKAAAQLLEVRKRWAGQEDRIGQLKYEARVIAKAKPLEYFSGQEHVAQFDARQLLVTTILADGQRIVLSYEEFDALILDPAVSEQAYKEMTIKR